MRFFIHTIVLLLIFHGNLLAQPQQYLFSYIGLKDGLHEENILKVQQDAKGYIWIATANALQRYDGQRFVNFYPNDNDPRGIPGGSINGMLIDKKNRLWILSGNDAVGYLDVNNFTYHKVTLRIPPGNFNKIAALHQDKDGNIMVIFVGTTFLTYNETNNEIAEKYNPFHLPSGWEPLYLWQDDARNYWVGSHLGLLKYSAAKKMMSYRGHNEENDAVIKKFEDASTVVYAYVDRSGRFWIKAWPKNILFIKSYRPATGETMEWHNSINKALQGKYYEMNGVTELSDGNLWIAGPGIFAHLNKVTNAVEPVRNNASEENSIWYDAINQLYEDRENNVWISSNKGLYRFNPAAQLFRVVSNHLPGDDGVHSPDVTDLLQMPDGEILVSTWGDGIFSYDKNFNSIRSKYVSRRSPPGENMVWCITRRKNGDIWRGSQNGYLFIYEAATGKTLKLHPPVFENSTIRQAEEDKDGNMWLGTQRGYLVKWNSADQRFTLQHQLQSVISRLYVDDENYVWVCTDNNGVLRINSATGSITAHFSSVGAKGKTLRINGATDIIQYNDSLYVITSDGLNFWNKRTGSFKYFTKENGLPSANLANLVKDKDGYIWMSSTAGIVSYHPFKKKLSIYNASDGVHTNSFSVASGTILNDGRVAFGTNHDLIVFEPAKITVAEYMPPRVEITGFALMNRPLSVDSLEKLSRIKLQHFEHSITIDIATLTYQNLYPIYYMMEGLDKEWILMRKSNQADYNYLVPGKYTFRVGCKDANGKFGIITTLEIYITPPFWKTWWFLSLLAFAAIGFIYWLDKLRVSRIRETERVRTRIATSLTKDMSNTLGNINVLSEMAKIKLDKDKERTREYIEQISESSGRMMEVMDDMIWSIDPENDELKNTIVKMKKYAATIQLKYNLEVSFTIDRKVEDLKLQMDSRHEFFLIFKEALLNTGKHANCKFVDVDIRLEKSKLKMTIADNGRGFNTEALNFARGINEMRKKAATMKATLTIRSKINSGTEVILEMNP